MTINPQAMIGHEAAVVPVTYGKRDTMLFALSIGLGADPLDPQQLRFVTDSELQAFPNMVGVLGWGGAIDRPEFGVDVHKIVVAGLGIRLHQPLPPEGELFARGRITDVIDKGKGALIRTTKELRDGAGVLIASADTELFARGQGGFGGGSSSETPEAPLPERAPDLVCALPTAPNMSLLYRLNGDMNPLHSDPAHALRVGFPRPILHGQASFAVASHAIVRTIADYDSDRLYAAKARLTQVVFPGETLRTEMWIEGETVRFRTMAVEREVVVLDAGTAIVKPRERGGQT
jgi:acyl dehydratase